jgi:transposase-like protein
MSEGRKTKSGVHYNYVDRRKAALRSLKIGTAQAAREYGVSEGSIKSWRKMYGLDNETGYGGTMDRYFCQRCVHGCGNRSTFTGCSYLLHTGEKRPHKNGWCLGFEPREGVRQSTVERYEKETQKHEEESEEDHMDAVIEPKDIDKVIQDKANSHTQGMRYDKEEKLRVLEVYDVYNLHKTCDYFGIVPSTIKDWSKRRDEIKAMRPTKNEGTVRDEDIINKKGNYTDEEKAQVLKYGRQFGATAAQVHYGISEVTYYKWKKAEVAADTEETSAPVYRKLTPEDVPDVPEQEEVAQSEPIQVYVKSGETLDFEKSMAEDIKAHIWALEEKIVKFKRMLDILEGKG